MVGTRQYVEERRERMSSKSLSGATPTCPASDALYCPVLLHARRRLHTRHRAVYVSIDCRARMLSILLLAIIPAVAAVRPIIIATDTENARVTEVCLC